MGHVSGLRAVVGRAVPAGKRRSRIVRLVPLAAMAIPLVFVANASALNFGVASSKQCIPSALTVGQLVQCEVEIANTTSDSTNTVRVIDFIDSINGIPDPASHILINATAAAVGAGDLHLTFTPALTATPGSPAGAPFCTDVAAAGAPSGSCTLPFGAKMKVTLAHTTVKVTDFPLIEDQGTFTWLDSCNVVSAG